MAINTDVFLNLKGNFEQRLDKLSKELRAFSGATDKELKDANLSAKNLDKQFSQLVRELLRLRAAAGNDSAKLKTINNVDLTSVNSQITGLKDRLTQAGDSVENFGNKSESSLRETAQNVRIVNNSLNALRGLLAKVVSLFSLGFVGLGFKRLAKEAATFGEAISDINSIISESSITNGFLRTQITDLAAEFGADRTETARAYYQAVSGGAEAGAEANALLSAALKAAAVDTTDIPTALNAISAVVNAFGLEASEAGDAASALFTTVQIGKTTFSELGNFISTAAGAAASFGVSYQELLATIATQTKEFGTNTATAFTQTNALITAVTRDTDNLNRVFERAGFANGEIAIGAIGLTGVLRLLSDATNGSAVALSELLNNNIQASRAAQQLTKDLRVQEDALDQITKGTQTLNDAVEERSDSTRFQFNRAFSNFNDQLVDIIEGVEIFRVDVTNVVEDITDKLAKIYDPKDIVRFRKENISTFVAIRSSVEGILSATGQILATFSKIGNVLSAEILPNVSILSAAFAGVEIILASLADGFRLVFAIAALNLARTAREVGKLFSFIGPKLEQLKLVPKGIVDAVKDAGKSLTDSSTNLKDFATGVIEDFGRGETAVGAFVDRIVGLDDEVANEKINLDKLLNAEEFEEASISIPEQMQAIQDKLEEILLLKIPGIPFSDSQGKLIGDLAKRYGDLKAELDKVTEKTKEQAEAYRELAEETISTELSRTRQFRNDAGLELLNFDVDRELDNLRGKLKANAIGIDEFFSASLQQELRVPLQELANIREDLANSDITNEKETQKVIELRQEELRLEAEIAAIAADNNRERITAVEEYSKKLNQLETDNRRFSPASGLAAEREIIERQYAVLAKIIEANLNSANEAIKFNAERAKKVLEEVIDNKAIAKRFKELQRLYREETRTLSDTIQRTESEVQLGLSTFIADDRIVQATRQAREAVKAIADELKSLGSDDPAVIRQIQQAETLLIDLQAPIGTLRNLVESELNDSLTDAFNNIITGAENVKQAFGNMITSLRDAILNFITSSIVQQFTRFLLGAFGVGVVPGVDGAETLVSSDGGYIKGYARGGKVLGAGTTTSDSIPAYLSRGEYVVRAAMVNKYGVDFLEAINRGVLNASRIPSYNFGNITVPKTKFNTGGLAAGSSQESSAANFAIDITVNNNNGSTSSSAKVNSSDQSRQAQQLGEAVKAAVSEQLIKESRPGGLIYGMGRR